MKLDVRYSNHPEDSKRYDTEALRRNYFIEKVFVPDEISLTYSHQDRMIAGGACPVNTELKLGSTKELGTEYFLERREMGIINVGGKGTVLLDGTEYVLDYKDGLYIGMGTREVVFRSESSDKPAKFYLNSCPAHQTYPAKFITKEMANHIPLGTNENMNRRVVNQYIHSSVLKTCQLSMGMTELAPCNTWNTMPAHTHERRMEVYFYFELENDNVAFHFMGQPQETRHIIMHNEQAVISPSWSIHSAAATSNYTFIWGMCGENQTYDDMDTISNLDLR